MRQQWSCKNWREKCSRGKEENTKKCQKKNHEKDSNSIGFGGICFAACNDDDDSFTPKKPVTTFAGQLPTKVGQYTLEYDEFGRCTIAKYGNETEFEIDYAKGTITLYEDDEKEEANVKFNKQGYITEISMAWDEKDEYDTSKGSGKITFNYNKEGQLVSASSSGKESGVDEGEKYTGAYNNTSTFTWENGNLVKSVIKDEEIDNGDKDEFGSTYTIQYGDQENEAGQNTHVQADVYEMEDCDVLVQIGLFGKATAFFPKAYKEEWYEKNHEGEYNETYEHNVSYDLNEDGTIKTEHIDNHSYHVFIHNCRRAAKQKRKRTRESKETEFALPVCKTPQ